MSAPLTMYAGASPLGVDRGLRSAVANAVRSFHEVRESAPTVERTTVREATIGGAKNTRPGRMLVRLIKAGVSLNGNAYPANVLEAAAQAKAWPKGCKAYIDHATPEEEEAHPSGSVKNLAAVLTEDARWDPATESLVAEVRLFEPWRTRLTEMAEEDAIGMSIRAWVTGERREYEGRECFVVDRVEGGRSVDFVTVPAAGGSIISVLEAAQTDPVTEAANLGAWLESRLHLALTQYADDMYGDGRLTRAERITLSAAIGDGLTAWTARIEADAPQLFQRSRWAEPEPETAATAETAPPGTPEPADTPPSAAPEDVTDGTPPPAPATPNTLEEEPVSGSQTGAPPEQAGTATVPDNAAPAGTTEGAQAPVAPAQPSQEAFAQMVAAAVAEATRPLTAQIADLTAANTARAEADRADRNRQIATEAVTAALRAADVADVATSITPRVTSRVTAAVPTTAEGAVDDARLGELITSVVADEAEFVRRERANALADAGVGLPYGMGGSAPAEESVNDGLEDNLKNLFENLGMPAQSAEIAAKGRVR